MNVNKHGIQDSPFDKGYLEPGSVARMSERAIQFHDSTYIICILIHLM